jgi:hypothetical protein
MRDWQELYAQAVQEADDEELKIHVDALETALLVKLQELATKNGNENHDSERFVIQIAIGGLRRLQVERLRFPRLPGESSNNITITA